MDHLALYLNDADHALPLLQPLLVGGGNRRTTLVLCPPRFTHHVGRWLSNRQREHWRRDWAQGLRQAVERGLGAQASAGLGWVVATGPLPDVQRRLRRQSTDTLRVVDLRRPHVGHPLPAVSEAPSTLADAARAPLAVGSSLAVVLALVD